MLDEPSLGLAPLIVQQVFRVVADIRSRGTTVLVEQNAHMALSIADRGYVLESGQLLLGRPDELRNSRREGPPLWAVPRDQSKLMPRPVKRKPDSGRGHTAAASSPSPA